MGSNDVGQLLRAEITRHAQKQLVERQVATGVNDGAGTVVDNQELVGLNSLFALLNQVGKHQAGVVGVAVKFNGHRGKAVKGENKTRL